ncbi:MAG: hypothetical protein HYR83_05195 [Planctomycetes bacterium]|nr:hypothetical protein [Planctomycetota bacterium]
MASGAFAVPTLHALVEAGHDIATVVSQPARESGRGRTVTRTPAAQAAVSMGIPILEVENVNAPEFINTIRNFCATIGIVIAFGQKIGPELRTALPLGILNLHASLLPKYRGAAPINWAIMRGETPTGCTVFRIVDRMDAGPVFAMDETTIGEEETAGELYDRLARLGIQTVLSALDCFKADPSFEGTPQDDSLATKAPKLQKSDGVISFDVDAQRFVNHVRGVTPWPGAQASFVADGARAEPVVLTRVRIEKAPQFPQANEIEMGIVDLSGRVRVADGFVQIVEIKPAGGRAMSWGDFANGRRLVSAGRFVTPTGR